MLPLPLLLVQDLMRSSLLGAYVTDPVVPERKPHPARPRVPRRRPLVALVPALARRSS